jgi:CBS-domain-containing membrane protein
LACLVNVVAVQAMTSVEEIARLLMHHAIGGVPVVDARWRVIGIVTKRDLFLKGKAFRSRPSKSQPCLSSGSNHASPTRFMSWTASTPLAM